MLAWREWTWPTGMFFIGLSGAMAIITAIKIGKFGTNKRHGMFRLTTTREGWLFLSPLGSAYNFLAWPGLFGTPL